jgi:hypothetical protein
MVDGLVILDAILNAIARLKFSFSYLQILCACDVKWFKFSIRFAKFPFSSTFIFISLT